MPIRKQIQFLQCWTVQGDNEDDIDEQINDSDTEFIAPREIDEPDNSNILTPEADVHIITTVVEKVGENNLTRKKRLLQIFESSAFFKEKLVNHFEKMQNQSKRTSKLPTWMFWWSYLFFKAIYTLNKTDETLLRMSRRWKHPLVSIILRQ